MKNKKKNTAFISFWLVIGANKKTPLVVCPSLVSDKEAENIDSFSIEDVWKATVQIPIDAKKESIVTMIPEIIKLDLEKDINKYKSLWEIPAVKIKCESLTTKYIENIKSSNK